MVLETYEWPSREEATRALVHPAAIIVVSFLLAIVFASIGYFVINQVTGIPIESGAIIYQLWGAVLQFAAFIVAALYYVVYVDRDIIHVERPGLRTIAWIVGGFVLLFVVLILTNMVLTLFDVSSAQNQVVETGNETPVYFLYMIPIAILFVGPGEELLFRGIVQGRLREAFGVWPGILAASALFGFAHYLALVGSGSGKLIYIAIAAVLGLVLGAIYEYAEDILVPIAVHGFYNAVLFAGNWYLAVNDIPIPS